MQLSQPRFVLVNTSHPGNIGGSARAMKNMGQTQLCLVSPKLFPSAEATARASGADDLLAEAKQFAGLDEAIADTALVFGASARQRRLPMPALDPRACAELICQQPAPDRVAILFGNEQSGLSNEELDRCHYLVQIPTNPIYPSLNLAAAVQVIAYELRMAAIAGDEKSDHAGADEFATVQEVEQFYAHLEKTLIALGYLDPHNPKHLMRRLRRLYGRVRLDNNEVNILRGILTAVNKRL